MKTQRVLNRLSKCANVRYHKDQMFLWFTLNSQPKLKKFSTLFLSIYQEKLATKFNTVSRCALWVGDPVNFHNSFFVKNYYLNLNLFSSIEECSPLKRNKKPFQKRWKSTKNCLTVDIAGDRSKAFKNEKEKRKMRNEKNSNNSFVSFTFFILGNLYFVRKHIWRNLADIVTFPLPFFHVAGYWKCSNTNANIDIHWFCTCHTSIQNTWQ